MDELINLKLDTGKYLNRWCGEYSPQLIIITDYQISSFHLIPNNNTIVEIFNAYVPLFTTIFGYRGQYKIDEKSNKIFDLTQSGHILVGYHWVGFGIRKTINLPFESIYHIVTRSKLGGIGVTYHIYNEDIIEKIKFQ